jgi:hypothetical protein
MRLRCAVTVLAAAAALVAAAPASAQRPNPSKGARLVKTLREGARSPVAFASNIRSADGPVLGMRKGAPLRPGEIVQIAEMRGRSVAAPRDCSCQGHGLRPVAGTRLVGLYVKAVRKGRTLAVAPAQKLFIEGSAPNELGFTYGWRRGTKRFPRGTKVVIYGFFLRA